MNKQWNSFFFKGTHFFRHIHYRMVQLPDTAGLYILSMTKLIFFDYDFFKICCSSRKYMPSTSRTDPSFPSLEITQALSSPISPGCLQGLRYISHTLCPNLNYVYYSSTRRCFQNQYLIGWVRKMKAKWPSHLPNVEDWHAAFGVCGLRDGFLFLREVVRGSSGFRL